MSITVEEFHKNPDQAIAHFCAVLEDRISDAGHSFPVRWEFDPSGVYNIFIGGVEWYTIYSNTLDWLKTYRV